MIDQAATYYLYLAALLFSAGVFVVLTKKNSVFVLMGVELILNSANLVLATFSIFDERMHGQVMAVFAVVLTVCEVSIALAILLNVYRKSKVSNLDELTKLGNP